jgi:branched-chain amino acid transport system ATP-binding protein
MSGSALAISGLNKRFGGLPATRDVSLAIAPGERHLIIGPNGAGKTTLFNQITGDLTPDSGSIKLFDQELTKVPTPKRVAMGLSRTYQILTLFPHDSFQRNVELALLGLVSARWDAWRPLSRRVDLAAMAHQALEEVSLGHKAAAIVAEASYGERRRLELAMALVQKPKVLLLDEPLAGLSQEERHTVRDLLEAIPRDVSILLIEHDMDVALSFAERITVLHFGQVITQGTRADVVADPRTREIYLGE